VYIVGTGEQVLVDLGVLQRFEAGLDPRHPERGAVPATVLGYGEISTVLEIGAGAERQVACKRMPMFRSDAEAEAYQTLYAAYCRTLQEHVGIALVPGDLARLPDRSGGLIVMYIVQPKLDPACIGNRLIRELPAADAQRLVRAILGELQLVFTFNRDHRSEIEVGLDGQISNWAVANLNEGSGSLPAEIRLTYFDTSTPLMRRGGQEQLDPELFLRSAPSFLAWLIRRLFLKDVMERYYDPRRVVVDLLANFYKEGRPDLIPALVDTVNGFFPPDTRAGGFEPLTEKEVRDYYRADARIWRSYLAARRIDRSLHRLMRRPYPYVLPGKTRR
jgi:hypothetical protein